MTGACSSSSKADSAGKSSIVDEAVVAGVAKSRGQKDDQRDAYGLAEKLRTGSLDKRIFKAPGEFAMLRELARTHQTIARDLVRVQVRLKSLYRSRGILTPGRAVYGKTHREPWQQQLAASARTTAGWLYEQIDFLVALKERAEQDLIRESRKHPIARILETTAGLGPIRIARVKPRVCCTWARSQRPSRVFWSYCGLAIAM